MKNLLGSLMSSSNSLKMKSSHSGATILGVPINTLAGDKLRIRDNDYELTPEVSKALSYTGYTVKTMRNEDDILMMYNIIRDLGYTGRGNRQSSRKILFTRTLPDLNDDLQNKTFVEITDNSDDLQEEGLKIIMLSNIIDIYTRLEILLGLKLSGHTDTPTKPSNFFDKLYERGDIQNEQQNRNALDKLSTY